MNYNAGCKTAMANVVQAIIVALALLFLAPLFGFTPLVALSAIIISAMLGLIPFEEVIHLYKVDKFDFVICMVAFLGVILVSMDIGLMLSVSTQLILFFNYRFNLLILIDYSILFAMSRLDSAFLEHLCMWLDLRHASLESYLKLVYIETRSNIMYQHTQEFLLYNLVLPFTLQILYTSKKGKLWIFTLRTTDPGTISFTMDRYISLD